MNNWLRDPIVWLVVGIALLVTGIVIGIMLIASIKKKKKEKCFWLVATIFFRKSRKECGNI